VIRSTMWIPHPSRTTVLSEVPQLKRFQTTASFFQA
jgi:hypothetical protein